MRQPLANDPNGRPVQCSDPAQRIPRRRHEVPPISPIAEKLVRRTALTGSGWIVFIFCGIPGLYLLNIARLLVGEWGGAFFTALILGLLLLVPVAVAASRRTQFDADGIHVRGLWSAHDAPWPRSRSGLVVQWPAKNPVLGFFIMAFAGLFIMILILVTNGDLSLDEFPGMNLAAQTYVLDSEGEAVWLAGMSRRGLSRSGTERRSSAELDRIWNWAIARGYTWETDTYVSPERLRAG